MASNPLFIIPDFDAMPLSLKNLLLKFELSRKHTKFEKIFLKLWTFKIHHPYKLILRRKIDIKKKTRRNFAFLTSATSKRP